MAGRARLKAMNDDVPGPTQKPPATQAQLLASLREIQHLKTALDAHSIVAITDPRGRITCVNDKFCEISQYPRGELLGQEDRGHAVRFRVDRDRLLMARRRGINPVEAQGFSSVQLLAKEAACSCRAGHEPADTVD